jgi:uncharacterized protein (DUF983 family)
MRRPARTIISNCCAAQNAERIAWRRLGRQHQGAESDAREIAGMRSEPDRASHPLTDATPSFLASMGRGMRNRCPVCGEGRVFAGFLRVAPACAVCGAPLGRLRADDAPPYVVIFLVGHLLVPIVFWVERNYEPPMWLHMAIWLPLFAVLCTLLLRPVKGGVVGYMARMGFLDEEAEPVEAPKPVARAVRKEGERG